jgi:hypothetical protein
MLPHTQEANANVLRYFMAFTVALSVLFWQYGASGLSESVGNLLDGNGPVAIEEEKA